MDKPTCVVEGCDKPRKRSYRMCSMHLARKYRTGTTDLLVRKRRKYVRTPTYKPILERLVQRMEVTEDGCWNYTAGLSTAGYGYMSANGSRQYTHRIAYELLVGEIPDGLELDHLCRNPACFNPDHLEPVTHMVNQHRGNSPWGKNARKTHCIHGHEFTPENTYLRKDKKARQCETCRRERAARRRAERRAQRAREAA